MSSRQPPVAEAQLLLRDLVIGESPRWHDDRLWFANWGTGEIVAVDLEGRSEIVGRGPPGLGWSIDWLPDGRLLVTGEGLMRLEPDGSMVAHADLSGLGVDGFNEIVVDGRGNFYVNGGVDFDPGQGKSFAGRLTAFDIGADGSLSNRRVWSDGVGPDGICIDGEGAIWTGVGPLQDNLVGRVREGGEVLERVRPGAPCFACMLGGQDRRTLFMLTADWRMNESFDDNIARLTTGPRTGRLLTAPAAAPGVGWP
jgi:sugar lactone lactonase YvrE